MRLKKDQLDALSALIKADDEIGIRRIIKSTKPTEEEEERKTGSVNFHFDQLKKHLVLDDFAKMIVLGLSEQSDANEMWGIMTAALSLTPKQEQKLQNMRSIVSKQFAEISSFCSDLEKMSTQFHASIETLKRMIGGVTDVLSPTQEAKHLLWREQNRACLQMINCMWKMKAGL